MPTYVYRCKQGHEFEAVQSMSDAPLKRCRQCRSGVQRVFQPVGIVLKGPGFYKTDSRAAQKKPSDEAKPAKTHSDNGGSAAQPKDDSSSVKSDSPSSPKSETSKSDKKDSPPKK